MNKKLKLLSLVTLSLCLNACGVSGNNTSKTSSNTSSYVSFDSTIDKLKYYLEQNNNCTFEDAAGEIRTLFFSENAFFYDFCELYETDYDYVDCGYLKSSQGIFKYFLDNNKKVVLDHCESVGESATVKDLMYYPADMFKEFDLWDQESETVYTTADKDVRNVVAFLAGYTDYATYITDMTITFEAEGVIENVVLSFKLNGTLIKFNMHDFGTTKAQWIDDFNANPIVVEDPKEFPAEMKTDMENIMHKNLPFYKASYAISYDHELQTLYDYGCGNIVESYGKELQRQGYFLDTTNSKSVFDTKGEFGFVDSIYYRNIMENNEIIAIDYVEVGFTSGCYFDDYYWTDGVYERIYPMGRTTITFVSKDLYNADKYNAFVSNTAEKYGGFGELGQFKFSEKNYFAFSNFDAYASTLGVECYYTFSATYSDEQVLLNDVNDYISSLNGAEYILYDGSIDEGVITLYKNNEDYSLNLTISIEDNKLSITVFVAEAVIQPEGFTLEQINFKLSEIRKTYAEVILVPDTIAEIEEINYMDLTELYKGTYEGKAYEKIYLGAGLIFNYEKSSDVKKTAEALGQALLSANYVKNEIFTFEEDDYESYVYTGENYTIETTILIDETSVTFIMMICKPF